MKSETQSGNVLFLILIAVALFAALSYAVTSSTRSGGGDASREKIQLAASQLVNQIVYLKSELLRASYAGDGMAFTYTPNNFYDPDLGRIVTIPSREDFVDPSIYVNYPAWDDVNFGWYVDRTRFWFNNDDVGTSQNDTYLFLTAVDEDICREIHKKLNGSNATVSIWHIRNTGPKSITTDSFNEFSGILQDRSVSFSSGSSNHPVELTGDYQDGCFRSPLSPIVYSLHLKVIER